MIVDAHLHVWRAAPEFPNPSVTVVSPLSDVPFQLLEQYMEEYGVDRAVLVQPLYPGEDNIYVANCAASNPAKFASVCVVDPRKADALSRLTYWVKDGGCRGLRLRPRVPEEAGCFGEPSTFPIWEFAQEAKIVVSVLGDFAHLEALAKLARRFSDVPIVVDHLAHPADVEPGACEPLLTLSECPNVLLKISGFPHFCNEPYPYRGCIPLVRAVHARFGAERMIWGSDFPHVLLQSGYSRALHWLERTCDFLDASEVDLILGGNASRLYWRKGTY